MRLHFSANKSDWVLDKFDVTVPMSTYLVAYTINDFEFRESPMDGDVVFRIWARRDAISQVSEFKVLVTKSFMKIVDLLTCNRWNMRNSLAQKY